MRFKNTIANRHALARLSNELERLGVAHGGRGGRALMDPSGRFTRGIDVCSTCISTAVMSGDAMLFNLSQAAPSPHGKMCGHCDRPLYE